MLTMTDDQTTSETTPKRGTRAARGRTLPFLSEWRQMRYLTQAELADKAHMSRSTLARAERGDEAVSFPLIRRLAEALGIAPADFQRAPREGE